MLWNKSESAMSYPISSVAAIRTELALLVTKGNMDDDYIPYMVYRQWCNVPSLCLCAGYIRIVYMGAVGCHKYIWANVYVILG